MKKGLKKFFISKTAILVFALVSICFWALWGVGCLVNGFNYSIASDAIFYIALIVGLLIAYTSGETNVQKALIGALLLLLCNSNLEIFWTYLIQGDLFFIIIDSITLVLAIIIFIGHLVQQTDHAGKSSSLLLNQCCGIMAIILLIYAIRQLIFIPEPRLDDFPFIFAWVLTYLFLICIETRIQVYKQIRNENRAAGTWTEEKRQEAKELFKL